MSLTIVCKMFTKLWGLFWLVSLFVIVILDYTKAQDENPIDRGPGEVHDYCNYEDFEASCGPDEVIMTTSAKYGRMSLGRCVKRNYGYLGCALDALAYVDAQCSGRRQCSFHVFEDSLRELQPCPEDISAYLEASYSCQKVSTGSQRQCQTHHHIKLNKSFGYIATVETEELGFGSAECPWNIVVSPGQRINITLFNFARHPVTNTADVRPQVCYEIGEIKEKNDRKRITLCDALGRQTSIFVSKTNSVSLQFVSGPTLRGLGAFVFKYEVVGCPDIRGPPGAEVKRDGDHLTVICGPVTRSLTCRGSKWIGEVGNCSVAGTQKGTTGVFTGESDFPYGILIVVSIGVALGVFFGGLLLSVAVMYMRRRQRQEDRKMREQQQQQQQREAEQYDPYDPESHLCLSTSPQTEDLTAKTFTAHTCPLQTCSTLDSRREVDILKQSCPYGTNTRAYCPVPRTRLYESPKFV